MIKNELFNLEKIDILNIFKRLNKLFNLKKLDILNLF